MKILHINSIGWRTWSARLCETIAQWLKDNGIKSHTIVWYDFAEGKTPNIESIFYTKNNLLYTYIYKFFIGLNFLFDFMRPWYLSYKKIKKNKHYQECNIVHIHCPEWWYFDWRELPSICKEKKVVMILWDWIASGNDDNNYFFWKTKKSFEKRMKILKNIDIMHIWVSERSSNKSKRICWFKKVQTIHNGIDTNKFYKMNKEDCRKKLWLPVDKKIIFSIAWSGSKSNLKGIQYIERIVEKYKDKSDYLFISVGNWSINKNEKYRELWLIPYNEINLYYNAVDCFLYPTLADNCPLVILECIACWCPVVAFDVWGVAELMQHKKNGYIVKYKDYDELVQWFEWVMNNKEKLTVSLDPQFTQQSMIKKYIEVYKTIL